MKNKAILNELITRYPALTDLKDDIAQAADLIIDTYRRGGKVLICGSGGSAADALHIVGELMKSFVLKRKTDKDFCARLAETAGEDFDYLQANLEGALPAIALVENSALQTAFSNDVAGDLAFAQQTYGYGKEGDLLIAISTSGNSRSGVLAAKVALAKGMHVVALTGEGGGKLGKLADACVAVHDRETFRIQELHLPIYHALCLIVEDEFFAAEGEPR